MKISAKVFVLTLLGFLMSFYCHGQEDKKSIRKGNQFYKVANYEEAEQNYRQALDENSNSFEGAFNLGDAAYRQEKYEDAIAQFDLSSKQLEDNDKVSKSYHNLGNSYLKSKDYEKSVEAFKNALRNDPSDSDSKYNLAYAQQKLKEQQKQEQQKDEKNENKDDKEDQKEKQEEKNDQQKQEKEQNKEDNQNNKEKQDQQPEKKPGKMSKEDAQRILDALKNEEQNIQEKLKKKKLKATKIKIEKDW